VAIAGDAGPQAALGPAPLDRLLADLRAGLDERSRRVTGTLGTIGFCFGGDMVWNRLDRGEARLVTAWFDRYLA
jgi:carboxymethylenebutenolidase